MLSWIQARSFSLMLCGFGAFAALLPSLSSARGLSPDQARKTPGIRMGTLPVPRIGILPNSPMDPSKFSKEHHYKGAKGETGILYTCRGGYLDMAHLRKASDWTAWLEYSVEKALREGRTSFGWKAKEPSEYYVKFNFPAQWNSMSQAEREALIPELAIRTALKLAYTMTSWHEVITWYGWSATHIISEKSSAFSYEDAYSNYLGSVIAARAIREPNLDYDTAMTQLLKQVIVGELGAVSKSATKDSFDIIKGDWWNPGFGEVMKKRNADLGIDDGKIDPWLVPGLSACAAGSTPIPQYLPDFTNVNGVDFSGFVSVEIEPHIGRMMKKVYGHDVDFDRVNMDRDFPGIMSRIQDDIRNDLGANALNP